MLFYAVAVFLSFLAGLLAMLKFSWQEGRRRWVVVNGLGTVLVGFTLVINLFDRLPAGLIRRGAHHRGHLLLAVRAGRPRGVSQIEQVVEEEVGAEEE